MIHFLLIFPVSLFTSCGGGGGGGTQTVVVVKKAPKYDNCPPSDIQNVYYAAEGKRESIVTWKDPTASSSNKDGSIVR